MPQEKLLAEWFWVDRWVGSRAFALPIAARGLYREMLSQAWRRQARLPNDYEQIQRMTGVTTKEWRQNWPLVQSFWRIEGDYLVNDTQIAVYEEAMARSLRASERALKAARARIEAQRNAEHKTSTSSAQAIAQAPAQAEPELMPPISDLRSPSPIVVPTEPHDRARVRRTPIIGRNAHLTHALCDETHAYCVPAAVHQKLAGLLAPKFGGDYDKAADALLEWYPTVWANLVGGFVMGEAFRFWQGRFDATFATVEAAPSAKSFKEPTEKDAEIQLEMLRKADAQRERDRRSGYS